MESSNKMILDRGVGAPVQLDVSPLFPHLKLIFYYSNLPIVLLKNPTTYNKKWGSITTRCPCFLFHVSIAPDQSSLTGIFLSWMTICGTNYILHLSHISQDLIVYSKVHTSKHQLEAKPIIIGQNMQF